MGGQVCEIEKSRISLSTGGLCGYSDVSSSMNQMQGLMCDEAAEMFNLTTGLDMIGFSSSNKHTSSFFPKPPSSSTHFLYHEIPPDSAAANWAHNSRLLLVDDSTQTQTQGLSLSLSSIHPSVGASFDNQEQFVCSSSRISSEGLFGKSSSAHEGEAYFLVSNSKYLVPAQQLLMELCSLGSKEKEIVKEKSLCDHQRKWEELEDKGGKQGVGSLELHKRKTRLVCMVEEVERRYRHYCNQMKGVVSSFEGVAGKGAARVYSALALKAMSRHFKCLKDGIMGEVEATRRCMGEKEGVGVGTKGETPRLKVIDQSLRQQRGLIDSHPWRPQRGLPQRSVSILRAWLFDHFLNPYPSDADKHILARQTGLSRSQVSNWFINARVRLWKPMVEEMYLEEVKEHENTPASSEGDIITAGMNIGVKEMNKAAPTRSQDDEKLTLVVDQSAEYVSSLIPKTTHNYNKTLQNHHNNMNNNIPHPHQQQQSLGTFGSVELDFSGGMVSFSGSGNVSLTLGLQQQGGGIPNAVTLAFPPASTNYHHAHTSSLLMYQNPKDQIHHHDSHYSLLDNQPQNLPYTHLLASHQHLLHHHFPG